MTRKRIFSIIVGVIVLGIASLFVYGQFSESVPTKSDFSTSEDVSTAKEVVIPGTIDEISMSIASEAEVDVAAFDAEATGAVAGIETNSQGVNNLGASYDENVFTETKDASCSFVVERSSKIESDLSDRINTFEEQETNYESTIENNRDQQDSNLDEKRSSLDELRNTMYAKLDDRAITDEEKSAVATYKKRVEEAVDKRREAIDDVLVDFRASMDSSMSSRKSSMDTTASTFKKTVEAALNKAKSSCEAGLSAGTVQTTLRTGLETARMVLQADRKDAEKTEQTVKTSAETRRIVVKKVSDEFKTTVEATRIKLKKAFGETSN